MRLVEVNRKVESEPITDERNVLDYTLNEQQGA